MRSYKLDILRILACCMVVLMHSPMPTSQASGPFLYALGYFTSPCIGLFFMVSGSLLLPVRNNYFEFLRKRFSKIAVPTIFWSLIYLLIKFYHNGYEINLFQSLLSIPFSAQGSGVLWFMYTLAGLYLIAPILSVWVEHATKREFKFVLLLWIITLCYPLLDFVLITNNTSTGILYYFGGYAGYFLMGYYLRKYHNSIPLWLCSFVTGLGIIILLALKYYNIPFEFNILFGYESIFIMALAVAIYKIVTILYDKWKLFNFFQKNGTYLIRISNCCFGVYLVHILIMRHWLWQLDWIINISNYPLQCFMIFFITIILSTLLCLLISRLPGSTWIIGYKQFNK